MALFIRALAFLAILTIYFALGWVNWEVAGKIAPLGLFAVLAVSAWTTRNGGETRVGKTCVFLVVLPFLAIIGFHAFLRDYFGVGADEEMVVGAIFSTDRAEAAEFIDQQTIPILKHVGFVLGFAGLFALALLPASAPGSTWAGGRKRPGNWKLAAVFASLFLLLHLSPSMRNQNPALVFPIRYSEYAHDLEATRSLQLSLAATTSDPQLDSLHCIDSSPRTIVFVLGESVTRLNLSAAGYARKTTPKLEALGDELIWFSDVITCEPTTLPAMKKILTPADLSHPDLWLNKPDVVTMARKAGYKTFWISNHSTDAKGIVSVFTSRADKAVLTNRGSSRGEGSYDEVVLPALAEALHDPSPRKLVILHLLNAHPAYYFRYPNAFTHFNTADDEVTKELKAKGRAFWAIKMRNYYDNAILYTDHVLERSLALCRESPHPVAWLFVSDHGQDVAHYSNFSGQNARARSQYEIPMIFWRSPAFPAPSTDPATLRKRPYQTDLLDHTLLGLMGIVGDYYDPRGDIFSSAFEPAARTIRGQPYP